jgi:hypothetical protein
MIAAFLRTNEGEFDTGRLMAFLVILMTSCGLIGLFYSYYKSGRLLYGGRGAPLKWVERAKSPKNFWFLFVLYGLSSVLLLSGLTYVIFQSRHHT